MFVVIRLRTPIIITSSLDDTFVVSLRVCRNCAKGLYATTERVAQNVRPLEFCIVAIIHELNWFKLGAVHCQVSCRDFGLRHAVEYILHNKRSTSRASVFGDGGRFTEVGGFNCVLAAN